MGRTKLAQVLLLLEPATLEQLNKLAAVTGESRMALLRRAVESLLTARKPVATPVQPEPAPRPADLVRAQKAKPTRKGATESDQDQLRKQFERWSAPAEFDSAGPSGVKWRSVPYDRDPDGIEIRMSNPVSPRYVGMFTVGGAVQYRRVPAGEMKRRIASAKSGPRRDKHTRRRLRELHPDKLGRDQTAAERAEYVELTGERRPR